MPVAGVWCGIARQQHLQPVAVADAAPKEHGIAHTRCDVSLKKPRQPPKTSQGETAWICAPTMISAPIPPADERRLQALREMLILDTPPEERFDRIVRFASGEFDMPIVMVSLVDAKRLWFKARVGLDVCEVDREISFCGHAIVQPQILVVEDALHDERFHDNPLVTGAPHARFYAGAPLQLPGGEIIGTLCMIDRQPRTLDDIDLAIFSSLRELVVSELVSQEVAV